MAAHQAPLSLGFSRHEHWSGLPFPSPMHESEKWKWSCSVVSNFATPWTATYQAPPFMGFSRQEYWSGVPSPSPLSPCSTLHILLISFIIWYKCTIDRVGLITAWIFSSMTGMTEGTEGTYTGIIMIAHEIFSWTRRKVEAWGDQQWKDDLGKTKINRPEVTKSLNNFWRWMNASYRNRRWCEGQSVVSSKLRF